MVVGMGACRRYVDRDSFRGHLRRHRLRGRLDAVRVLGNPDLCSGRSSSQDLFVPDYSSEFNVVGEKQPCDQASWRFVEVYYDPAEDEKEETFNAKWFILLIQISYQHNCGCMIIHNLLM